MRVSTSLGHNSPGYFCFHRHILSNVGRVVARDSSRTHATVNDLFVALCEDDSIYGFFRTMRGQCTTSVYIRGICS